LALAIAVPVGCGQEGSSSKREQSGYREQAQQILDASGVKGGLVVHVGCGDGKLTAELRANDSYLVHGLDTDAKNIEQARTYIQSLKQPAGGLYGKVSVDRLSGNRLPYIDNLVNLVVSEDLGEISMNEVMRVLAPKGVAYIKKAGAWTRTVKPRPKEIDEWTHYWHDSTGNAVADDFVVGPPQHMQWVGSPQWARHHDHMASMSALVAAGGRIFYIIDEGPKDSIQLPPKWFLVARDAFNGVILWKQPIPSWYVHLWPLKSGPAQLPRRLVAVDDSVYVTLGINAPLTALDAATGKTIRTYDGTKTAEEIVTCDGVLFLLVNPSREPVRYAEESAHCWDERDRASKTWAWDEKDRWLMAVEADTGNELWKKQQRVVPLTLAADRRHVFFHDGQKVVCLDRTNGEQVWGSEPISRVSPVPTGYLPKLVVYRDVVLFSGKKGELTALSAETGGILWTSKLPSSGHFCPEDVFVINGLVWAGAIANARDSGVFTGQDVHTGEVRREFAPDVETYYMHQRCYPSKATVRYLIPSRTGTEFIDPQTGHWIIHHWVRGGCIYGIMPCNGLLYTPPHSCACYYQSKLNGFCALAPAKEPKVESESKKGEVSDDGRLEKGPAYSEDRRQKTEDRGQKTEDRSANDWPTYRHDAARSGFTKTTVAAGLTKSWEADLGGKLTSLVVADDKLFVASVDKHKVYALDASVGKILWSYTAGGRVDSPPTIYQGRVLFGSADGWVYCLDVSDGELAWRFRAAPEDQRLMSYEQLESVWPVHGSVLVQDGVIYCLAGRSMFLDGGMRLLRLELKSGRKLSETILDSCDPETGKNLQDKIQDKKMPVALPDVLSSDGKYVYMRSQRFDLQGRRAVISPESEFDQQGEGIHLFCPTGFLDDSWFHRSYWIYGKNAGEGWAEWFIPGRYVPSGQIIAFDDSSVYGFGRHPQYLCNSSVLEYRLFATDKNPKSQRMEHVRQMKIPRATTDWKSLSNYPEADLTAVDYTWLDEHLPLLVRAMVLANKTLFIAGPPVVVDEQKVWGYLPESPIRAQLDEQSAALEGQKGALLWVVSASNGEKLAEYNLESVPVWDGMVAANGRLYLSMKNGKILCFGGKPARGEAGK
jgi:outer membrane protein assembly factor BamB